VDPFRENRRRPLTRRRARSLPRRRLSTGGSQFGSSKAQWESRLCRLVLDPDDPRGLGGADSSSRDPDGCGPRRSTRSSRRQNARAKKAALRSSPALNAAGHVTASLRALASHDQPAVDTDELRVEKFLANYGYTAFWFLFVFSMCFIRNEVLFCILFISFYLLIGEFFILKTPID